MMRRLDPQEITGLRQGLQHFQSGDYFAAHDDWEEVWRGLHGRRRLFWQAMIQLAVGAHHWQNGNLRGCQSVWNKALQKCDDVAQMYEADVPDPLIFLIDLLSECVLTVVQGHDPLPTITDFATSVMSEQWLTFA